MWAFPSVEGSFRAPRLKYSPPVLLVPDPERSIPWFDCGKTWAQTKHAVILGGNTSESHLWNLWPHDHCNPGLSLEAKAALAPPPALPIIQSVCMNPCNIASQKRWELLLGGCPSKSIKCPVTLASDNKQWFTYCLFSVPAGTVLICSGENVPTYSLQRLSKWAWDCAPKQTFSHPPTASHTHTRKYFNLILPCLTLIYTLLLCNLYWYPIYTFPEGSPIEHNETLLSRPG